MKYNPNFTGANSLLMLLLFPLVLAACGEMGNEQKLVENARTYISENKLRAAAIELKNALQRNPSNAEARYLLGDLHLDLGDPEAAQKEFRKAEAAGWSEEEARLGVARAIINSGKHDELLERFEIKDSYAGSVRANLYGLKAIAVASAGETVRAREFLATAERVDPDALEVLKAGIRIELAADDREKAAEYLDRALERFPDNREILLQSALLAQQQNRLDRAIEIYRSIIDRDPALTVTIYGRNARLGMARIYLATRRLDEAEAVMKPLFRQNANDPFVNYIGGLLAFEQEKLDLAEERLLKVLRTAPGHNESNLLYGAVSFAQADYEQAAYYVSRYLSAVPGNIGARKLLGRTYMILGRNEEARNTLQPGLETDHSDAELLALIGLSQIKSGNLAQGVEGLERAAQAAPGSNAVRSELARAYISAGETERAIQELQLLLKSELGEQDKARTEALLILAHLRAGQHNRAIDTVLGMLRTSPDDPDILTLAGNVFSASGDRPEARKYFIQAREIEPEHLQATMSLAVLEELEGDPEKAEALYRYLLRAQQESSAPMLSLARIAEERGEIETMVDWLEKAHARFPQDAQAASILAEYYLRTSQADLAERTVEHALKANPDQLSLQVLQSRIDMSKGQHNEALKRLGAIVAGAPESLFARSLYAEVFLGIGQPDDARKQLRMILERDRNYPSALALMAKLELQTGNVSGAQAYVDRFLEVRPESALGNELEGDVKLTTGDFDAAVAAYRRAWESGRSSELTVKLARTMLRADDYEGAVDVLSLQLEQKPDDQRTLMLLANAHQRHGKTKEAADLYRKVLSVQPDQVVALNNLAWLYVKQDPVRALELAERAYNLKPDDSGIQDTYGWLLVKNGQAAKGRHVLEKAMSELSQLAEVRYHYAAALAETGEKQKAIKILNNLLQEDSGFEGRADAEALRRELAGR